MPERNPIETTNLDIYGNAVLPWSRARDSSRPIPPPARTGEYDLELPEHRPPRWAPSFRRRRRDVVRRRHVCRSGPDTQKSRNLAQNPNCTLAMHLAGLDLILEGTAARVTDTAHPGDAGRPFPRGRLAGYRRGRRLHRPV